MNFFFLFLLENRVFFLLFFFTLSNFAFIIIIAHNLHHYLSTIYFQGKIRGLVKYKVLFLLDREVPVGSSLLPCFIRTPKPQKITYRWSWMTARVLHVSAHNLVPRPSAVLRACTTKRLWVRDWSAQCCVISQRQLYFILQISTI